MSNATDLLSRALEELEIHGEVSTWDLIKEIRTFLVAEPEAEPAAWIYKGESWFDGEDWNEQFHIVTHESIAKGKDRNCRPLYLHPPRPEPAKKPMTEEELENLFRECHGNFEKVVRAIEKHHGIGADDE